MEIINEDLVELGFPDIILENTFFWGGKYRDDYEKEVVEEFYETLFCLAEIYREITGNKAEVKKEGQNVYLNGIRVFHFSQSRRNTYKKQSLRPIKELIKEIIEKGITEEELVKKIQELYNYYDKLRSYFLEEYGKIIENELVKKIRKHIFRNYGAGTKVKVKVIENGNFGEKWKEKEEEEISLNKFFNLREGSIAIKENELIKVMKGECLFIVLNNEKIVNTFKNYLISEKV